MSKIPRYEIQGLTTFGESFLETASGLGFDMLNPNSSAVRIDDVAHALSLQCRFNGHTNRFYSVAEHSVLVSDLLKVWGCGGLALAGLLHDASEAYIGDLVSPVKFRLRQEVEENFRVWDELEAEVDEALHKALDLSVFGFGNPLIKRADQWALKIEAKALLPSRGIAWCYDEMVSQAPDTLADIPNFQAWLLGLDPETAKALFLARFRELS